MWLVSGRDEEHRFRTWAEAFELYRRMVHDCVDAHGDPDSVLPAVEGLARGQSHRVVLGDAQGARVEFRIGWETAPVGLDHYTAC